MLTWLDTLIQGLLLGGLFALYAIGLSLTFGVMRIINLAHGDLIVCAAYLMLVLSAMAGLPIVVSLLAATCLMFVAGFALQSALLNPVVGDDTLRPLLVTFGLSVVIQNGLQEGFSANSRRLSLAGWEGESVSLGSGIAVGIVPVLCFLCAVATIVVLNQVFYATALGRAFRAASDDIETAQLVGIRPKHLYALALGLSLAVAALAGFFLGARANFDPTIGPARLIYAFEAVIIGGLGSLWGTLAGGIILGLAQTIAARIDPEWQILGGHLAFLLTLILRPSGLFPRRTG